jgi:hypothetical protein
VCFSLFFHSTTSVELHFGIGQKENGLIFMFELVLIAILIAQVQGITNEIIIILVCSIHWDMSTHTFILQLSIKMVMKIFWLLHVSNNLF